MAEMMNAESAGATAEHSLVAREWMHRVLWPVPWDFECVAWCKRACLLDTNVRAHASLDFKTSVQQCVSNQVPRRKAGGLGTTGPRHRPTLTGALSDGIKAFMIRSLNLGTGGFLSRSRPHVQLTGDFENQMLSQAAHALCMYVCLQTVVLSLQSLGWKAAWSQREAIVRSVPGMQSPLLTLDF